MRINLKIMIAMLVLTMFVAACNTATTSRADGSLAAGVREEGQVSDSEDSSAETDAGAAADVGIDMEADTDDTTEAVEETIDNAQEEAAQTKTLAMSQLYRYGDLSKYEYRLTSTAAGQSSVSNMKYSLTSDVVDGKAAWKSSADVQTQGASVVSNTWLDKVTYKCLKTTSTVSVMGQTMENAGQCPTEGPNAGSSSATAPELVFVGTESVTVPAGTFSAEKYQLEGITYWYSSSVPLPLKVTYSAAAASTVMELVSYS